MKVEVIGYGSCWRWYLLSPNNRVLAQSAVYYTRRRDAIRACEVMAGLAKDDSLFAAFAAPKVAE